MVSATADAFRLRIAHRSSLEQLLEIDVENYVRTIPGTCATHDYWDANMIMAEVCDHTNTDLWNAAWSLALKRRFLTVAVEVHAALIEDTTTWLEVSGNTFFRLGEYEHATIADAQDEYQLLREVYRI